MSRESKSGIVVVDKPAGCTSHDLVARARRSLGTRKVGHAGTLDPFATGVVVLLINEGTKLSNLLMESDKVYRASLVLGQRRDTGDLTGEIVEESSFDHINEAGVRKTLEKFRGEISQVPPMYSAIKKDGVPLYKYARKGVEIERKERKVHIASIELLDFDLPYMDIEVKCSSGTYIRTLAEDIAVALGTCGYLRALRRTRSGSFSLEDALAAEKLDKGESLEESIIPPYEALPLLPEIVVKEEAVGKIANGRKLVAGWIKEVNGAANFEGGKAKLLTPAGSLLSIIKVENDAVYSSGLEPEETIGSSLRVFNNY